MSRKGPKEHVRVDWVVRDGEVEAESEEALETFKTELLRGKQREDRRRELWGDGGRESMTRLCHAFPGLRGADGVDPWDATALLRWACSGKSHGEVLAAKFVLGVWNATADWEEEARREGILTEPDQHFRRFDFFEAFSTWDHEHREAFLAWARDPFWP